MAKYFIDLGAWDGDTVLKFMNHEMIYRDDLAEFQIYAFEPHPVFFWQMAQRVPGQGQNVHLLEEAAWIEDGEADFTLDVSQCGTLVEENHLFNDYKNSNRLIKVKTIDFSKWLEDLVKPDDYVIIKVDIEGAEFQLLEDLIKRGSDKLVDEFLVEFHQRMFANEEEYQNRVNAIESALHGKIRGWV